MNQSRTSDSAGDLLVLHPAASFVVWRYLEWRMNLVLELWWVVLCFRTLVQSLFLLLSLF
jgi:hypothetical protein